MNTPRIILRHCPEYDVDRIHKIVRDGLDTLGLRPHGRTLIKPNVVASGPSFPHAYTRPEFTEGVVRALKDRAAPDTQEIAIGERCGITMPTRFAYKGAGYYELAKRAGVELYHYDEVTQVEIPLYHDSRLRDSFFTPEPVARADFFVNCPKFKAHPWTTVTFSMKNYIGIQDDRHRLIDHDHRLNEKVRDLQYIIQPQFIAIDAITAGEGRMLTPIPFDMGLVIMGDNQVAFDAVCCAIIGIDPLSVPHIRMAFEEGFGPVDLDQIEITGDVTLAQAKKRAQGFRVGLVRVEEYFEGTNIRAYSGPPPAGSSEEYCWGGCPGAMEEAIEILRLFDTKTDEKMPRTHIVFGAYDGDIDYEDGDRVVFIGDCASFQGKLGSKDYELESVYVERSAESIYNARTDDIYTKMVNVQRKMFQARNQPAFRMAGCPVSVAEQVLMLVSIGKLKNPYLDPSQVLGFNNAYFSMRIRQALARITGNPYQRRGPTPRGQARPEQNLPPEGADRRLEQKLLTD
ncbi:MAG: DUF362 domain-containing protein [Myxococcota bacterium]